MANAGMVTSGCSSCCPGDICVKASDDFDRDDAADLGADFTIEAGDIYLNDNAAESDTADSVAWHVNTESVDSVAVTVSGPSGSQARVLASRYTDGLGRDVFVIAEWEFGASAGTLRVYNSIDGAETLHAGQFVIPDVGAGVATRIKVCWGVGTYGSAFGPIRVRLTNPTTGALIFATGHIGIGGGGNPAGFGTGDVPSGVVTFENFVLEQTSDRRAGCPDCKCACADCGEMCVRFPDDLGSGSLGAGDGSCSDLNGDQIVTGGCAVTTFPISGLDCIDPLRVVCHWTKADYVFDDPFTGLFTSMLLTVVLHQGADDHWYATVILRYTYLTVGWVMIWTADLGADVPDCRIIECASAAPDTSCGVEFDDVPCGLSDTTLSVSSGESCCEYGYEYDPLPDGNEDCCADRDPLPTTLYATLRLYGAAIGTDVPLTYNPAGPPTAPGYDYDGDLGTHPQGCTTPVRLFCDKMFFYVQLDFDGKNQFGVCTGASVLMRVISCDPFHAVPEPAANPDGIFNGTEVTE